MNKVTQSSKIFLAKAFLISCTVRPPPPPLFSVFTKACIHSRLMWPYLAVLNFKFEFHISLLPMSASPDTRSLSSSSCPSPAAVPSSPHSQATICPLPHTRSSHAPAPRAASQHILSCSCWSLEQKPLVADAKMTVSCTVVL